MDKTKVTITGNISYSDKNTYAQADLLGKTHTILPTTMMVEGSYFPNVGADHQPTSLHFSSKDLKQSVNTWNGRPVAINHPDAQETCNSPETFDKQWVGYVFNTRYDAAAQSLKADLWIDNDRGAVITNRVKNGDRIDVSIGAFGDLIPPRVGSSDTTKYDYSMTNIVGDHLAVLPDGQGACSWKDGCGIRASAYTRSNKDTDLSIKAVTVNEQTKKAKGDDMENCEKKVEAVVDKIEAAVDRASVSASAATPAKVDENFSMNSWLNEAPADVREGVVAAMEAHKLARQRHIDTIISCNKVTFCEKELCTIDKLSLLESIAKLVDEFANSVTVKENVNASSSGDYKLMAASGGKQNTDTWATFKDLSFDKSTQV